MQVRSLTLDVRVWDDGPLMQLMEGLGNAAGNEVWEETLRHINARADSWVWWVALFCLCDECYCLSNQAGGASIES